MTRLLRIFAATSLLGTLLALWTPAALAATPDIAAGNSHSIALKVDGTVWTWGSNAFGQLGNGTNTDSATPVQVKNLTGIVAIAAGFFHNLAVKSDGTVWAWGQNTSGQLGINTVVNSNVPVKMTGVANALAVAAGSGHSLVLTSSGIMAAGLNTSGQIGDNSNTQRNTAVAVTLAGVVAIAAGRNHSLALLTSGAVKAWGDNSSGQLGDGTTTNQKVPITALGLASITQISTRDSTNLALRSDGLVFGWGNNVGGQVGDGTLTSPDTPAVQSITSFNVTSVASGGFHSVAIAIDGSILGWGTNSTGQLTDIPSSTYTVATGLISAAGVTKFSAGYTHTLGYKPDGTVIAFGSNGSGQLGDGTTTQRLVPVTVKDIGGVGFLNLLGLTNFSVVVTGGGQVSSSPAGINCSAGTCVSTFSSGTVVTLTATPTSGNTFQGWNGACSGTGTCVVTINGAQSVAAVFTGAGGGPIVGTIPDTGWWWNPAEAGRGFMIEQRNGKIFMATFLYSFGGQATWFGSGPTGFGGGSYSGVLNLYGSGQTLTGAYQPATQVGGTFGSISIIFSSNTAGSLTWPGGTIPIQRYDFVTGGSSLTPPAGTPEAGWWWNPNEPGRGFSLEIQNNTILIAGYMYDANGNPIWYLSTGPMSSTLSYQGNWVQYGYGETLTGAFHAASVVNSNAGALTIQFSSPTAGTMTLPDGRQIPIARFSF